MTGIYLEYREPLGGDGTGAQLQRLAAIYGIARKLGFGYRHVNLTRIAWSANDGMETALKRSDELSLINDFFRLPSNRDASPPLGSLSIKTFEQLTLLRTARLFFLHRFLRLRNESLVVRVTYPYRVVDPFPSLYGYAARIWSRKVQLRNDDQERVDVASQIKKVAVHFRRATIPAVLKDDTPNPRFLPSWWYDTVVGAVESVLDSQQKPREITIHTDYLPGCSREIPKGAHPGSLHYMRSSGALIGDASCFNEADDLQFLLSGVEEGSRIVFGVPPLQALLDMASADVFVGGKSSLSMVVGLMRHGRPVIMPSFWHGVPRSWITIGSSRRSRPHSLRRRISRLLQGS